MVRRRHFFIAAFAALATLGVWFSPRTHVAAQSLPTAVSDKDFWAMVVGFSEPGGFFRSDNLISNETAFQHVIPELQKIPIREPMSASARTRTSPTSRRSSRGWRSSSTSGGRTCCCT